MDWKQGIDKTLQQHLEFQLKEVNKYSKLFAKAKNPSKAQLWCAIANLSKLISALNVKCKELENQIVSLKKNNKSKVSIKKKVKKKSRR